MLVWGIAKAKKYPLPPFPKLPPYKSYCSWHANALSTHIHNTALSIHVCHPSQRCLYQDSWGTCPKVLVVGKRAHFGDFLY